MMKITERLAGVEKDIKYSTDMLAEHDIDIKQFHAEFARFDKKLTSQNYILLFIALMSALNNPKILELLKIFAIH